MVGTSAVELSPADGDVDTGLDAAVALLTAAADPYRLKILRVLAARTTCVCDLQAQLPIASNLLSYHLKVLREAGLIVGVRRGRWIDYSLTGDALDRLRDAVPATGPASARVARALR
jgi:ArsR family transcriptional regulator